MKGGGGLMIFTTSSIQLSARELDNPRIPVECSKPSQVPPHLVLAAAQVHLWWLVMLVTLQTATKCRT
jgi:hypothetical protein